MRVGSTPPSPLPPDGSCGGPRDGPCDGLWDGDAAATGGGLPGARTGVGLTGGMPLLEKAAREVTDNMRGIIRQTC
jgi:hypothetical protein